MRSNIRAGQSNIVAGARAMQDATTQFRGSNCFEERRGFMGNEEKKNITIADVAEALGVSKTTVSRAISGKGRIGQDTRDRLSLIHISKGLAQSKTYNLCVVMPGEYDVVDLTFFQECLFGIQEIAGIMEYDILLSICKNNDISSLERIISNRKVDGVILMRTFVEDRQIEYLQEKKVPFVTIGSSNYTGVIQIDHNHKSACKELTSIILMKGMKRIALIGGDENHVVTQSRLRGFREAYEKMGEVIDPTMLFLNLDNHVVIDKIVEEVLERKAECILCMDDAVCSRVLKKLREKNVKVPKDIRVASFYNSSVLENNVPSITSLSFDAKELGMVACKTVLDVIEGAEVETRTLLPYEVVLKESTK